MTLMSSPTLRPPDVPPPSSRPLLLQNTSLTLVGAAPGMPAGCLSTVVDSPMTTSKPSLLAAVSVSPAQPKAFSPTIVDHMPISPVLRQQELNMLAPAIRASAVATDASMIGLSLPVKKERFSAQSPQAKMLESVRVRM